MKVYCEKTDLRQGHLWHTLIVEEWPNDYIEWVASPSEADVVLIHAQSPIYRSIDWDANPHFVAWMPFDCPPNSRGNWNFDKPNLLLSSCSTVVAPNRVSVHSHMWHPSMSRTLGMAEYQDNRTVDFMSVHYASYPDKKVEAHRDAATQAALALPPEIHRVVGASKSRDRRMHPKDFMVCLSRSKVMLSADGFGPVNKREFEAICFGCVVIKPKTIHSDVGLRCFTWPDPFDYGQIILCETDFSDLAERVEEGLELFDRSKDDRKIGSKRLQELEPVHFFERLNCALEPFMKK